MTKQVTMIALHQVNVDGKPYGQNMQFTTDSKTAARLEREKQAVTVAEPAAEAPTVKPAAVEKPSN